MSPSFSVKNGVRYPFYVSQALLKGRKASAGSVPRIAASAVEAAVLKALGFPEQSKNQQPNADIDGLGTLVERVVITKVGLTLVSVDKPVLHVERQWKDDGNVYGQQPDDSRHTERDPKCRALTLAEAAQLCVALPHKAIAGKELRSEQERTIPALTPLNSEYPSPRTIVHGD